MAHQLAHYDIYREELAKAYPGFGYALWEPGPEEQGPHVEVGDVGFVREGQFHRLFNALLPGEHESHERFGVPDGHEPLRLTVTDHITRRVFTPNTFRSHGVTVRSGGLEVLAAMTVGSAEVSFSCTRKHGAVLSLPVTARCENTLTLGHFRKWIIKHIDSWLAFTNMHGLELQMEDIVLVTGCHRTRSWSNIAFNEVHADARFSLGVEVAGAFGARINWRASSLRVEGAILSQGPSGENLPENQCIFIRGFRVKRIIWGLFPRIEGAAEPKPHPPGNDCEPEKEVLSIPSGTEYRDPLHVLLQYIAERMPDCDMALVHDDDLEQILRVNNGTSLETLQPDAVMNHLERSRLQVEIGVMSDSVPSGDQSPRIETGRVRVAMLSEHLKDHPPSVPPLSHLPVSSTNRDDSAQSDIPVSCLSELAPPVANQDTFSELDDHGLGDHPKHRQEEYPIHIRSHSGDEKQTAPAPVPFQPDPRDGNESGSPLTEINPKDSVDNTTLVRAGTPPGKRESANNEETAISSIDRDPTEPFAAPAAGTSSMTRKRTSLFFDGVVPPARKQKTSHSPAPLEPVTLMEEEEAQVPQSTSTTLEPKHVPATTIDELTITLKEQNKRIEELVQDNVHLREELVNLSRTFQLSKMDLQRVENTIPKLTAELQNKFEKTLEKTEERIQGSIDRLLEELGRIRARPTPVHASSTPFPQNTEFVPDTQAEGEGSCAPPENYSPPGPNSQEDCEPLVQPTAKTDMERKIATKLSAELKDRPSSGLLLPVHVPVGTANTHEGIHDEPSELIRQDNLSDLGLGGSGGLREYSQREHPASNARSGDEERAVSPSPPPQSRSTVQPTYSLSRDTSDSPRGTPSPQQRMGDDCETHSSVSLPGNAVRKRPRRYDEIERLYHCSWEGCTKSYGTLNHLNAHVVMQRHGARRTPAEFKELIKQRRILKKGGAKPEHSAQKPEPQNNRYDSYRQSRGLGSTSGGGDTGDSHGTFGPILQPSSPPAAAPREQASTATGPAPAHASASASTPAPIPAPTPALAPAPTSTPAPALTPPMTRSYAYPSDYRDLPELLPWYELSQLERDRERESEPLPLFPFPPGTGG